MLYCSLVFPSLKKQKKKNQYIYIYTSSHNTFHIYIYIYIYNSGSLWNEPSAKSCVREKQPLLGSKYPGGLPPAVGVLKSALVKITKPVKLLDITLLSLLRKDGHPSIYGLAGPTGIDCSHWCLAGVPDTWNHILYNLIL
jgi:hypothetical protein